MVDEHIARVIANFAVFLEYSPNDILDDDAAVEAMEQLAAGLKELSLEDQKAMAAAFQAIAGEYDAEVRDYVETLGDGLGLGEQQ